MTREGWREEIQRGMWRGCKQRKRVRSPTGLKNLEKWEGSRGCAGRAGRGFQESW